MKTVTYTKTALKALRRIPTNTAKRITGKINDYARDPQSQANNVKKLQGREGIRLRVGSWRVIMKDGQVLEILDIGSRGGIYE